MLLLLVLVSSTLAPVAAESSDVVSSEDPPPSSGGESSSADESSQSTPVVNFNCTTVPTQDIDWVHRGDSTYPVRALPEARPDMPWGDVVTRLECWLYNPHSDTIVVAVQPLSDVDVYGPDARVCIEWNCVDDFWNPEYTLEVSENITVDWVLYAESLAWDAPAGETLVEVGLKVVNYGTDRTPCPECEVRVMNTTLDLGAWWRVTWGGYLAMNSSYCAGQEHQTERNRECFPMPTLVPGSGWVGHFTPHPLGACQDSSRYGDVRVGWRSIPTQEITVCGPPSFDNDYIELFQAGKFRQAQMLGNRGADIQDDDRIYWAWYDSRHDRAVDDLPADYWSSQECPSESFETVIYPSIIGNHVPDVEWKAEIRAHHYDFDLDEWTVFTLAERFYNSSNYTGYNANESRFNIDASSLDEGEFIWFDWVIYENGTRVGGDVIGECLTPGGVEYMEDLFSDAQVTMGLAGLPIQQVINRLAYIIGIPVYIVVAALAGMIYGVARLVQWTKK